MSLKWDMIYRGPQAGRPQPKAWGGGRRGEGSFPGTAWENKRLGLGAVAHWGHAEEWHLHAPLSSCVGAAGAGETRSQRPKGEQWPQPPAEKSPPVALCLLPARSSPHCGPIPGDRGSWEAGREAGTGERHARGRQWVVPSWRLPAAGRCQGTQETQEVAGGGGISPQGSSRQPFQPHGIGAAAGDDRSGPLLGESP